MKTGGAAFPRPISHDETPSGQYRGDRTEFADHQDGMTLRDYFAAKAMQAILGDKTTHPDYYSEWAELSYRMADAMLAEREKE